MDNHIMYLWDLTGQFAIRRCCFCKHMTEKRGLHCEFGFDCMKGECAAFHTIDRAEVSVRLQTLKKEMQEHGDNEIFYLMKKG